LDGIIIFRNLLCLNGNAMQGSAILLYDEKGGVIYIKESGLTCLNDAHDYLVQLLCDRNFAARWKTASGCSLLKLDDSSLQPENTNSGWFKFLRNAILYNLSKSEINVIYIKRKALRNNDAAGELCRSNETVKSHLKSIYLKLGVNSILEALKKLES
jgi:DNA-binding CsgD family transcriptional regulator